jgi:ubiquinone/menaquinone biosynthesis C-methylase UbiE
MKNLLQYYNSISNKYDSLRLDSDAEIKSHCDWFVSQDNWSGKKLLEVGCGTGRYTYEFANLGLLSIGIDHSLSQLSIAINKVPVIYGNALNIEFSQIFDSVAVILMLHQLNEKQIEQLSCKIYSILNHGGVVWVKTCSHLDLYRRPFNDYYPSSYSLNVNRYPDISKLNQIFDNYGFKSKRETNICDKYFLKGSDIIKRFEGKHNSTLHLIPEHEFTAGLMRMKMDFSEEENYSFSHYHTLIEYIKI